MRHRDKRGRHAGRGLADGNDVQRAGGQEIRQRGVGQRAFDDAARADGIHAAADDVLEVLSECRERAGQEWLLGLP